MVLVLVKSSQTCLHSQLALRAEVLMNPKIFFFFVTKLSPGLWWDFKLYYQPSGLDLHGHTVQFSGVAI